MVHIIESVDKAIALPCMTDEVSCLLDTNTCSTIGLILKSRGQANVLSCVTEIKRYHAFVRHIQQHYKRAEVKLIMLSCMTDKERGIIPLLTPV